MTAYTVTVSEASNSLLPLPDTSLNDSTTSSGGSSSLFAICLLRISRSPGVKLATEIFKVNWALRTPPIVTKRTDCSGDVSIPPDVLPPESFTLIL